MSASEPFSLPKSAEPIAVVGLSALFPGSIHKQAFWRNIVDGRDFVTEVPPDHWLIEDYYDPDPTKPGKVYTKRGAFLPKVPFSPIEFGLPPKNLPSTDSVQLLALLGAKQLLAETRSFQSGAAARSRTSVILGLAAGTELIGEMAAKIQRPHWVEALRREGLPETQVDRICQRIFDSYPEWNESTFPGLLANVTAGRIANRFDLGGANCVIDAACASSLAAITLAVDELRLGKTDLVVSGGADALNDIFMFSCFSRTPAMSFTGDCRPFSDAADGTLMGEGIGFFALRRLSDAERDGDVIYALIKGVGAASDGNSKSVYAPRSEGQASAIRRAWTEAGIALREVELIEAHGTATKAGDAAEFGGLCQAFESAQTKERNWCALGSIKSQIGHTKSAAGAAGLFKAVLALRHGVLPPTIKVDRPSVALKMEASAFYLNTQARPWIHKSTTPRCAGLSSFGFGGSNYHLALEEYRGAYVAPRMTRTEPGLVLASAATRDELLARIQSFSSAVPSKTLGALARESWKGFSASAPFRAAVLASDRASLGAQIQKWVTKISDPTVLSWSAERVGYFEAQPPVREGLAFLFPGQGSQYIGMGAELAMEFPAAQVMWDRFATDGETPLHRVVFPPPVFSDDARHQQERELTRTEIAQPAIGIASLAQLALLERAGVKPNFTVGHSYGELIALHSAGVIADPSDVVRLSQLRGQLMADAAATTSGAMTAVRGSAAEVEPYLDRHVIIANHNGPRQVVVSGATEAIEAFEKRLHASGGPRCHRLAVDTAFHSPVVAPAADHFSAALKSQAFSSARIPAFANLSGAPYPSGQDEAKRVLAQQLASPVRFHQSVEALYAGGARVFVEVGPGHVLTRLVSQILHGRTHLALTLDARRHDGVRSFLEGLGRLAVAGYPVDLASLYAEFEDELPNHTVGPHATGVVMINGTNLGKSYPPITGAAGRTPPAQVVESASNPIAPPKISPVHVPRPAPVMSHRPEPAPAPTSASLPADQLQRLALLEQVQRNMLEAQRHFQETLAQSHLAFLQTSEALLRQIGGVSGQGSVGTNGHVQLPAVSPVLAPTLPVQPAKGNPAPRSQVMAPPPVFTPVSASRATEAAAPQVSTVSSVVSPSIPTPIVERPAALAKSPVVAVAEAKTDYSSVILSTIAELTGYPVEMIEMEMELESGLGIDSIKKVEIFSALQAKIPAFAGANTGQVATLTTPRAILEFTHKLAGEPAEVAKRTPNDPAPTKPALPAVPVYAVGVTDAPPSERRRSGNELDGWHIIPDAAKVAEALVARFTRAGRPAPAVGSIVPDTATRVMVLSGLAPCNTAADTDGRVFEVFSTLRALAKVHRNRTIEVIVAQNLGGDFGLASDPLERATLGAIAGLAKSAAREWPNATVRVVDLSRTAGADELSAELFDELGLDSKLPEVGRIAGKRVMPALNLVQPNDHSTFLPQPNDVWIVSGGARGVTAACLQALVKRVPLRLAILGRTLINGSETPAMQRAAGEADLKRLLLEEARAAGRKPTPIELQRQVDGILAAREARANCAMLTDLGATVRYFPIDVADEKAVKEAFADIRRTWGPIRGVVHAAGVLADKALHEKTGEQFRSVYRTKVDGMRSLLSATAEDPLTTLVGFSSVAARAGNVGQADYAAANETLNKLCQAEQHRRGASCRVHAINWGPWDGGMVNAGLKTHFAIMGVPLIPLDAGAEVFADIVTGVLPAGVEVVVGAGLLAEGKKEPNLAAV